MVREFSLKVVGRKIAFSTFIQLAGKRVQILLSAISLKLLSNFLGTAGYGIYATIAEYSLFFSVAANLGIFGNTVRMMADSPKDGRIFINAMVLRIVTAVLFFIAAIFYALFSGLDAVFILGTALYGSSLLLDYVTSVCDGSLQANYMMGRATIALVLGKLVNIFVILLVLNGVLNLQDYKIGFLFVATLLSSAVTAMFSTYFVAKSIDWSWKIESGLIKQIFFMSLPFGIINIINSLYFRFLPDYFARNILTDAQFGSFNVSYRITQVLSFFSTFLMFSALPGFRQYLDNRDWEKAGTVFKRVKTVIILAGFSLVVFGSVAGPFALQILTNKDFINNELWFMLPMMLILAAISYGYDLVLITLFALNKEKWFLSREMMAISISIVLLIFIGFTQNLQLQIFLILLAAILSETFMVVTGYQKILILHEF